MTDPREVHVIRTIFLISLFSLTSFAAKYTCREVIGPTSTVEFDQTSVSYATFENSGARADVSEVLKVVGIPRSLSEGLTDVAWEISFDATQCQKTGKLAVEMKCEAKRTDFTLKARAYDFSGPYENYARIAENVEFQLTRNFAKGYPIDMLSLSFTDKDSGQKVTLTQVYEQFDLEQGKNARCALEE